MAKSNDDDAGPDGSAEAAETASSPPNGGNDSDDSSESISFRDDRSTGESGKPPESDLELLHALDDFLGDIDADIPMTRERTTPDDHYQLRDRFGDDTRAQTTVGVDYVRDDGIAVADDYYIGFTEVRPRNWLALDEDERQDVMAAYMSFLLSLQSPIVIPCYPKEFDLTDHLQQFYDAGTSAEAIDQSPILQYGRKYYIDWADRRVDERNIKRRAFYIVTRVHADHVNQDFGTDSALSRIPGLGALRQRVEAIAPSIGSSRDDEAREELCVREVRKRQKTIASNLGRTGVGLDIVRDRNAAMELLYYYYNHVDPMFETFDHATATSGPSLTDGAGRVATNGGGAD